MGRIDGVDAATVTDDYMSNSLVELTATIAWENASSKFNRALRIPSQGLWQRRVTPSGS